MRSRQKPPLVRATMACIAVLSLVLSPINSAVANFDPVSRPLRPSPLLNRAGSHAAKPAQMPSQTMMPMMFPLFLQNRDFSSTLVLTNAADRSTYADVMLTATDGKQITQQRVQFTAHSQRTMDLQSLLMSAISPATTGGITVLQDPQFESTMVILGQLSITYHASDPESSFVDEEISMPNAQGSQTLRAVAHSGEGSPLVAISNLSDMPQHVAISCLPENGQGFSKSVAMSAGETLLTESCFEQTIHGATIESFPPSQTDSPHGPMGISLTTDGMPGTLAAFGLQRQTIGGRHLLSNITFVDPMMLMSPSTVFDGVPVASSSLLRSGSYVPEISLTNFSAQKVQVAIQYAQSSGATAETNQVASFSIQAGSSKKITLRDLQGDPQLQDSFLVTSSGGPGDVLAKLVSRNESAPDQVELLGKDAMDTNTGGSNPWSIENGTQSTLLLFNHDQAVPQIFNVLVASQDGTQWIKDFTVAPMQTQAISIGEIVKQQLKDDKGATLSKTAVSGQISWWTVGTASGPGAGRLLQSNPASGSARSFACGCPYILCGVDLIENLQDILFSDTDSPFDTMSGIICMYKEGGHCSGTTSSESSSQALHYSWTADGVVFQISGSST
jgi:hypothetical protein